MIVRILVLALLVAQPALACRVASTEPASKRVREDKKEQRQIVRDLAAKADLVLVAIARPHAKVGFDIATFEAKEMLKGVTVWDLRVKIPSQMTVGCGESAHFTNPSVEPGKRHEEKSVPTSMRNWVAATRRR